MIIAYSSFLFYMCGARVASGSATLNKVVEQQ